MRYFNPTNSEFDCWVCVDNAKLSDSTVGVVVINKGNLCVNLSGEMQPTSRLSGLRAELDVLPKSILCPNHLKMERRKGGEWVTIVEAAAMFARRDKKENVGVAVLVESESSLLGELRRRYSAKE